ncbi:Predicted O-linked N-acetylglucosamine transferase, SPINDLY family [Selenomonas sp. GACV-9]|uniref:O-linked N-acetylglucosamine transferase family protein n=1 Tax=Selenomonas sp. GACV-9 TaxID=3158782 RepID=UPI0008F3E136|nr:Predicted O-linked N-acetylglucosamine transferase, SPINDLY family [Selenomonas ruminantium]
MSLLSACVIVRNEAENIRQWLENMKKIADELIVVDTGSTDDTVAIAQQHGARVYSFAWQDDFSAAKNYALEQAHGRWIAFLDADEYFTEESLGKVQLVLRQADRKAALVGLFCRIVNIDCDTGEDLQSTFYQVRLFRNSRYLRFAGKIHEKIQYSGTGQKSLEKTDDLTILHTGYSRAIIRQKIERNLKLLEQKAARGEKEDVDDYYLAECYLGLQDYAQTRKYAWQAIQNQVHIVGMEMRPYELYIQALISLQVPLPELTAALQQAIETYPEAAEFHFLLGLARFQQQEEQAAALEFQRGRELMALAEGKMQNGTLSEHAESLLPDVCRAEQQIAERRKSHLLQTDDLPVDSLRQRIYAALQAHEYPQADAVIRELQAIRPEEAGELQVSLDIEQHDLDKAEQDWQSLQKLSPSGWGTQFLQARLLFAKGETVRTAALLQEMLKQAGWPAAYLEKLYNLLGQCARFLGNSALSTEAYRLAAAQTSDLSLAALEYSNYLFNLHYLPVEDVRSLREAAAAYQQFFEGLAQLPTRKLGNLRDGRLRIGYISPDFREHVVLSFAWNMITGLDKKRFAVYAYACNPEDDMSRQLASRVDGWRNLMALPLDKAARVIYEDELDILVDLSGHTKRNCLPILAYKPAPIQISGIGYFASTGLGAIDYVLGDAYLDPEGAEQEFTEQLIRLPHSHFSYLPLHKAPAVAAAPCSRKGYITFGCFNNFTKVNDEVLKVWAEILRQVPQCHLMLKAAVFDQEDSREYVIQRLQAAGLPLERLELRGLTKNYLQEYSEVDIALDTFPYPGGGTTCDALYMGIPVVTLIGNTHGGRFGYSLLQNIDLGDLCAATQAEYVQKAVSLAADKELVQQLRQMIRPLLQKSVVMDAKLYCEELGDAYETVYVQAISDKEARKDMLGMAIDAGNLSLAEKIKGMLMAAGEDDAYVLLLAAYLAEKQDRLSEALALAEKSLSLGTLNRSQGGMVHHLQGNIARKQGKRALAATEYLASSKNKDIANGKLADYSNYLLNLQFQEISAEELLRVSRGYDGLTMPLPKMKHNVNRHLHEKLRVGYISPDFCRHIVACFSQVFFKGHDKYRLEVYGYANCREDDVTAKLAADADHWRNIYGLDPVAAARMIYEDEIDVLVDLSGHTGNNCLPILACRPAPVQISGIGYFATTGLAAVDYFITDTYASPQGEERYYTEKLLCLQHSHLCYQPLRESSMPAYPAACASQKIITFGSMNQFDKLSDELLTVWAEILRQVPSSRLFLKAGLFDDAKRTEAALQRLEKLGLLRERIITEGYTEDYLESYRQIDIALDSWPYPGGGTTCDALYMGVPVVTRRGKNHHQRFGWSLLANCGLEFLAADDWDGYIRCAVELARDPSKIAELHRTIRRKLQESAVMNAGIYQNDWENACLAVFAHWRNQQGKAAVIWLDKMRAQCKAAEQAEDWPVIFRLAGAAGDPALYEGREIYLSAMAAYQLEEYRRAEFWARQGIVRQVPELGQCMNIWMNSLQMLGELQQALAICQQELEKDISYSYRKSYLLSAASICYQLGLPEKWRYYQQSYEQERDLWEKCDSYGSWLYCYNSQETGEEELLAAHKAFNDLLAGIKPYVHTKARHQHKKLRIGYISPDFRQHVMYHFVIPFLGAYDQAKYEVYAYNLAESPDAYTDMLRRLPDHWWDVQGKKLEDIARCIYDDEIDILVDLAGHTKGSGLPVLAWKPAPIQISGLGYMATTGLKTVDYFLTDPWLDPEGVNERYFTENLLRLPTHLCFVPEGNIPESAGAPCKERGWLLFGVFNQYLKYTDEMIRNWQEILRQVPDSKLLLKSQVFFSPWTVEQAYKRLVGLGVDMDRVIFEPATREYHQRYLDVDIALDTYPYPGGGTTCDSLYMGVPVISRYSTRHSSRFSYSILQNVGLGELAVTTNEEYVARAVGLANDRELLDILHKNLRTMMRNSPMMDMQGYMQVVEGWYQKIWKDFRQS